MAVEPRRFVSRAGQKLEHALDVFALDVTGLECADFGCNVGGFTDCLLQRGARCVHAVETGYGVLDYTLRRRDEVIVMERTNALHADPPEGGVDLITIDLAWTRQRHALPAAARWLREGGRVITLIKPHYELEEAERCEWLVDGRLPAPRAQEVLERVLESLPDLGFVPVETTRSPLTGAKSSRRGAGNIEFLALLRPAPCRPLGE